MSYQGRILDLSGDDSTKRVLLPEALGDTVVITEAVFMLRGKRTIPAGTATPELVSRELLSLVGIASASKQMPRLPETEITDIELRRVPKERAIDMIKAYIDAHEGCRTGDIIYDLGLDPDLVLLVLRELEAEGRIRGENIG